MYTRKELVISDTRFREKGILKYIRVNETIRSKSVIDSVLVRKMFEERLM